jgi:hypothetical protein
MMWLFTIKTDGTFKARLVGRGDLMQPYVDFDPNAVYCGNVSACYIKMCLSIAAKYKLIIFRSNRETYLDRAGGNIATINSVGIEVYVRLH